MKELSVFNFDLNPRGYNVTSDISNLSYSQSINYTPLEENNAAIAYVNGYPAGFAADGTPIYPPGLKPMYDKEVIDVMDQFSDKIINSVTDFITAPFKEMKGLWNSVSSTFLSSQATVNPNDVVIQPVKIREGMEERDTVLSPDCLQNSLHNNMTEEVKSVTSWPIEVEGDNGETKIDVVPYRREGNTTYYTFSPERLDGVSEDNRITEECNALSIVKQQAVREILGEASQVSGYQIREAVTEEEIKNAVPIVECALEVTEGGGALLGFAPSDHEDFPCNAEAGVFHGGVLYLNNQLTDEHYENRQILEVADGSYVAPTQLVLHEFAHLLGLSHPGSFSPFGDRFLGYDLYRGSWRSTVMSYADAERELGIIEVAIHNPLTYSEYDVQALQILYGTPAETNPEYEIPNILPQGASIFRTLPDPNIRTINAASVEANTVLSNTGVSLASVSAEYEPNINTLYARNRFFNNQTSYYNINSNVDTYIGGTQYNIFELLQTQNLTLTGGPCFNLYLFSFSREAGNFVSTIYNFTEYDCIRQSGGINGKNVYYENGNTIINTSTLHIDGEGSLAIVLDGFPGPLTECNLGDAEDCPIPECLPGNPEFYPPEFGARVQFRFQSTVDPSSSTSLSGSSGDFPGWGYALIVGGVAVIGGAVATAVMVWRRRQGHTVPNLEEGRSGVTIVEVREEDLELETISSSASDRSSSSQSGSWQERISQEVSEHSMGI